MPPLPPLLRVPLSHRAPTRHLSLTHSLRAHPPRPPRSKPSTSPPSTPPPPPPRTAPQRPRTDVLTTLSVLLFFASWYPAWSFLTNNVLCIMSVTGPSMSPFLNTDHDRSRAGDWVWVDMWRAGRGLQRGMVVVYRSPTNAERFAVKRVIALEGDAVMTKAPYPFAREDVPCGHVWIEGDQLDGNKTMDSNWVGPVSRSLIVGRVGGVVWPWRKAGRIRWEDWKGSDRVLVGKGMVEKIELFH
ncbi:hypothetical protein IMSHALPRED_010483 [Imshaugia aleurites]|uniref:Peptidase S26 domain-containing protein n=1 Tax=Imshaugia aleurites TaxID=172621 RepID=A0A8H3G7E2_9LECA|nr:hypothetical protein IMSHALPRED_010483 [Imshaugia aleurites]